MKFLREKLSIKLLLFLTVLCFCVAAINLKGLYDASADSGEEFNAVTFSNISSDWNDNTETYNDGLRFTVLHFAGIGSTGNHTQGEDFSDLVANATLNGNEFPYVEEDYIYNISYNGAHSTWNRCEDYYVVEFNYGSESSSVYVGEGYTVPQPEVPAREGEDGTRYILDYWYHDDINTPYDFLTPVNGNMTLNAKWIAEMTVYVTFEGINEIMNDDSTTYSSVPDLAGYRFTMLHFISLESSGYAGQGSDFSDLAAKAVLNGQQLPYNFVSGSFYYGPNKSFNGFLMYGEYVPQTGDVIRFVKDSWFKVGGEDTNRYVLSEDAEIIYCGGNYWVNLAGKQRAEFTGVNFLYNNSRDNDTFNTILDFDINLGDVSNANNSIARKGIYLNGTPLSQINGAMVNYAHGFNHLYITIPKQYVRPKEGYPAPMLEVMENIGFENAILPKITLTLIGGSWVQGDYQAIEESEVNPVTISDLIGNSQYNISADNYLISNKMNSGSADFRFIYCSKELIKNYAPNGSFTVYLKTTNYWDGFRFWFRFDAEKNAYVVEAYDATMGGSGENHIMLGFAYIGLSNDVFTGFIIRITENLGKYDVVIGQDGLKLIEINDIVPAGDNIGRGMQIYSSFRGCLVKDYKNGDINPPSLVIHSREVYFLDEGDDVPDFNFSISDDIDDEEDLTIELIWDEGAITDNKMNAGEWYCLITVTDLNGNVTEKVVYLMVKGQEKFRITFDGKNAQEYSYGEKIQRIDNPVKEGTHRYYYEFIGWYYGDTLWDFDNDVVMADINLLPKFYQREVLYEITFSGDINAKVLATYGSQIDLRVFRKDGYDTIVKVEGEKVSQIIVKGDVSAEVSYIKAENTAKNGCKSTLQSVWFVIASLVICAGAAVLRKKELTIK